MKASLSHPLKAAAHTQATNLCDLMVQEAWQHEERPRRRKCVRSGLDTEAVLQKMPQETGRWPPLDNASSTDEGSGQRVVSPLYRADLPKRPESVRGRLDHMGFQQTNEPARGAYPPGGLRSALGVSARLQAAACCSQEGLPPWQLHASRITPCAGCHVWRLLQLQVHVARSTGSLFAALNNCTLHAVRFTSDAACYVCGLLQLQVHVAKSISSLCAALDAA